MNRPVEQLPASAPPPEPAATVIEPRKGLGGLGLRELWKFREVTYFLVWRDFKVRYRQTLLGIAWAVLQPLLTAAVLTLLFSHLANVPTHGVPYPLFVLAGLAPWQFFTHGVSTATMSMVTNQDLVRRIYFPRLSIPLSAVLSGAADLIIGLVLVLAALAVYGWLPPVQSLMAPLFLLLGLAVTFGVGLLLCAANVQYRDIGHVAPFALQIALFASPIAYPSTAIPEPWRLLYSINPMAGVIDGLRWSLFGTPLQAAPMLISLAAAAITVLAGALYLRRVERILADVI